MRLIFVRHPETVANVARLIYGQSESDYSSKGKTMVPWVVEQLRAVDVDAVYASPLKRTTYLAQELAKDHKIDQITFDNRLLEMNCGELEHMTLEEVKTKHGEVYEAMMADYCSFTPPGGESFPEVQARVVDFLEALSKKYKPEEKEEAESWDERSWEESARGEKTIVVVAHAMVIRAALASLLSLTPSQFFIIAIKPAAIVTLDYQEAFSSLMGLRAPK